MPSAKKKRDTDFELATTSRTKTTLENCSKGRVASRKGVDAAELLQLSYRQGKRW